MKTLDDFTQYMKINSTVQALRAERGQVSSRLEQIGFELSQSRQPQVDSKQAWSLVLAGEDSGGYQTDNGSELRGEMTQLEGRLKFVNEALTTGEMELDGIRGRCSLEICQGIRKEWVAEVRRILEGLKAICEANAALDKMRHALEENNIRTDSLLYSRFDIGGSWGDPNGGKIVGYQRECAEHFPELAEVAGQSIKVKLKALANREQEFERRE